MVEPAAGLDFIFCTYSARCSSRSLGWMFLGLAIGASEGIAARSLGKFSYGTIGGAMGGALAVPCLGWPIN